MDNKEGRRKLRLRISRNSPSKCSSKSSCLEVVQTIERRKPFWVRISGRRSPKKSTKKPPKGEFPLNRFFCPRGGKKKIAPPACRRRHTPSSSTKPSPL